jgi:hypothetical protein
VLRHAQQTGEVVFDLSPAAEAGGSELPEGAEGDRLQLQALRRRLEQLKASGASPVRLAGLRLEIAELEESLGRAGPPDEI